jgi:RNA polymerase sigma factor (sigma-70 family)
MTNSDVDRAAEDLISRYVPRLGVYLARKFRLPAHVARDIAHDAFAGVLQKAGSGAVPQLTHDLERYITRTAINRAIDAHRRLQLERAAMILAPDIPPFATAEDELLTGEQYAALRTAIDELPEPYQSIFTAQLETDRSLAEIARDLNLAISGIYTQYARGVALLRKKLRPA